MNSRTRGRKPILPVKQLAILCVARFAEPLALTSVFPYLPEMIASFGVAKEDVAKWAGLTGAIFSIFQSLMAVPWGRASDKYGRKPVILICLASTMLCFILYGLSTSLPMALTIRALMGGANGNVGILRTVVAEMVPDRSLQPTAFSLMPLVWSLGSVFGPAFGGFFARPAEQYPGLFGDSLLFKRFPFLLPNLIACIFFLISFTTAFLFLKETLESKRYREDWGLKLGRILIHPFSHCTSRSRLTHPRCKTLDDEDDENDDQEDDETTRLLPSPPSSPTTPQRPLSSKSTTSNPPKFSPEDDSSLPTFSHIFTPQAAILLLSYTLLALHTITFDQVLPVFLHYPVQRPTHDNTHLPFYFSGGFGLGSDRIGTIFAVSGVATGVLQFVVFPRLCARYTILGLLRIAVALFPLIYLLTPYLVLITAPRARFVALLILIFVKGCAGVVCFPCMTILLTNSAPSLRALGTLNGFAVMFSGAGRALGPALIGAIFSRGVQTGYMIAPWWTLTAISLCGAIPSWFVQDNEE